MRWRKATLLTPAAIRDAFPDMDVILHIDPWNDGEPRTWEE